MNRLRLLSSLGRSHSPITTRSFHSSRPVFADPFPLPFDSSLHPSSSSSSKSNATNHSEPLDEEQWPLPPPLDRTGEDEKTLRARLVYQSRKRGMLEGDLLLSTFARDELPKMNMGELQEFDKLLDEPDWDIYYWSIYKREPPEKWRDTGILAKLRQHAKNEGKVVRKMPDLMQQEPNL